MTKQTDDPHADHLIATYTAEWQAKVRKLVDAYGDTCGPVSGIEYADDPVAEIAAREADNKAARTALLAFLGAEESE